MSAATVITEPGVHTMTHTAYHSSTDWLSSTGARKLTPPSVPALFKHWLDNPEPPKVAFDIGNAAHDTLLGGGPEIVVIPDEMLASNGAASTKAAKEFIADARDRGAVPITSEQWADVQAMVAAVRGHPIAGRLFDHGQPEASLFWRDERTSVNRRARIDFLPDHSSGRLVIPDLKTCRSAQRDQFARSAAAYGYNQQADFYLDGVRALKIADDAEMVFVAVEKTPPYLVNVIRLDVIAMEIGARLNRDAIDTYAECASTDVWPGYPIEDEPVSLPSWYEIAHEQEITV